MSDSAAGADSRGAARAAANERYLQLVRDELPALARAGHWVVRDDHCFGRILLDHAVGGCWYEALDRRRVGFRQLDDEQLQAAVALAERIRVQGDRLLRRLNEQSLDWRGKGRAARAAGGGRVQGASQSGPAAR